MGINRRLTGSLTAIEAQINKIMQISKNSQILANKMRNFKLATTSLGWVFIGHQRTTTRPFCWNNDWKGFEWIFVVAMSLLFSSCLSLDP